MQEVVDEFAYETDDLSSGVGSVVDHKESRGRRTKSKPKRKPVEQLKANEKADKEVAEDVEQIVEFLKASNEQEKPDKGHAKSAVDEKLEENQANPSKSKEAEEQPLDPNPNRSKTRRTGNRRKRKRRGNSRSFAAKKARLVNSGTENKIPLQENQLQPQENEPRPQENEPRPLESEPQLQENATENSPIEAAPQPDKEPRAPTKPFKPISNWHKIMKVSSANPLSKWTVDQVFCNVLEPYEPRVPNLTSQRCIDALKDSDLEQLNCPGKIGLKTLCKSQEKGFLHFLCRMWVNSIFGTIFKKFNFTGCKDRFLLPQTFFQHIYRKSVRIIYTCTTCGDLEFHNRCHLRTHILSHLEVDGLSSVTLSGPDSLQVAPLTSSDFNIGFSDDTFSNELENLCKDYQLQDNQATKKCIECKLPVQDLSEHFRSSSQPAAECHECKMWLPSKCSLR